MNYESGGGGKTRVHSLFFKLFVSIMSVTVLILLVQMVVLVVMLRQQSEQFAHEAFSSYEQRLNDLLEYSIHEGETLSVENIGSLLWMAADDRILGLLLKNASGDLVFALGKTPNGIIVDENPLVSENGKTLPGVESNRFIGGSSFLQADARTALKGEDRSWQPEVEQDIVGTIPLYSDSARSHLLGSVDVLVLSPMVYAMKAQLIRKILIGFAISIPIALVIAFFGAHLIAASVSRHAERISGSLSQIAQGEFKEAPYETTVRELSQIGDSVEILKKQLSGHEKMRQQWLKGIAHDLNTPLTSLKLSVEGALDGILTPDEKLIQRIRDELEVLEQRVSAVMTLSSMQSPDFLVHTETIEVLDFVDEMLTSSVNRYHVLIEPLTEFLYGDRRLLLLAAREAMNNAVKYRSGDEKIRWVITSENGMNSMRFSNTGTLPPEGSDELFEPWVRADRSRSLPGSGMGLTIIRQIMENHGGSVSLTQEDHIVSLSMSWPSVSDGPDSVNG